MNVDLIQRAIDAVTVATDEDARRHEMEAEITYRLRRARFRTLLRYARKMRRGAK